MAKLDPEFTFENFVVGPANRLASAAARRAAERPGVSYNPLYIHASSGLGKTHLLGAVARHLAKVTPGKRVEYQTAKEFIRASVQYGAAAQEEAVRERASETDVLLLDDVHLLTAQPEAQDLLLLTLDLFIKEGKQVVLASDRPPMKIEGLGAHLRTRFEGGLLVNIGAPEYETRMAILQKWSEARFQLLGPGVADAIGRIPFANVTDLRAYLNRVLKVQELEDRVLSAEEAAAIVEQGGGGPESLDSEVGQFLDDLSTTVAAKVKAQEPSWRKVLREAAEQAEIEGFNGESLRRMMEMAQPPPDLEEALALFRESVARLKEIEGTLNQVGNPWPEAAFSVLRDPERVEEAEGLLASAQERGRAFPPIPPGPTLEELGGGLPKLVVQAAEQLVRTDRPEYTPLYVWSPDGMAARVLLYAAGRTRLAEGDESGVACISVHAFSEEFSRALSAGVAGAWRERWWSADLLLVEKAEALSDTQRAQEEVFHLLEALRRRRARVMVAADRPLTAITGINDRLRARLESGLVLEIPVDGPELSEDLLRSLETRPSPELPAEVEKEDIGDKVVDQDRAWIRSFKPRGSGSARGAGSGGRQDEYAHAMGGMSGTAQPAEPWTPSREQVVWDWPRIEDRIVEELDGWPSKDL